MSVDPASAQRSRSKPRVGRLENPPRREFRARGSFVQRCGGCQLPDSHCICRFRPRLRGCSCGDIAARASNEGPVCTACGSIAEFWLLMHPDEQYKPTNTGRLIRDCLPTTRVFTWHRKEPPPGFLELCQDPAYAPVIVFPAPPDRYEDRLIEALPQKLEQGQHDTPLKTAFILLDGTWQQAGKMFRLTRYLESLPVLSLSPTFASRYRLRRAVHPGQLCTAEVAAELLAFAGADHAARQMHSYFTVFSDHYTAARNNRPVAGETEAMQFLTGASG